MKRDLEEVRHTPQPGAVNSKQKEKQMQRPMGGNLLSMFGRAIWRPESLEQSARRRRRCGQSCGWIGVWKANGKDVTFF